MVFCNDHVTGRSYAPVEQTPVTRVTGQRLGCNMLSAITNKGVLAFTVFQSRFRVPSVVQFLTRLLKTVRRWICRIIVDGHPVHRSAVVTRFVVQHTRRLRLIHLSGYCPELNPDELLNQDVKIHGVGTSRLANRTHQDRAKNLYQRQEQSQVPKNGLHEKHV